MLYKDALKLKIGDKFKHNKFTGIYTIEEIQIFPKEVKLKCDDGYTYNHRNVKTLVIE